MPVLQVLTKAALLAYERLPVAQYLVKKEWNPEESPYISKLVAAWCFDVINSRESHPALCRPVLSKFRAAGGSVLETYTKPPANTPTIQATTCNLPMITAKYNHFNNFEL